MQRKGPRVLQYGSELWRQLTELDPEDEEVGDVDPDLEFPLTRADCVNGLRPCPFVRCEHHLYLRVADNGSIWVGRPEVMPWEMEDSCMLDLLDRIEPNEREQDYDDARARELDGYTLRHVGAVLGLTRERTRQVEQAALLHLLEYFQARGITWDDLHPDEEPEDLWPQASGGEGEKA